MPEAVFACLDSSEYMRNGDYHPTRQLAAQEALNLVLSAKMQANPENCVGFLTMGGKACTVMEPLTQDLDRIMASLTRVGIGGEIHFAHGLQIASLALSHRLNAKAEKRIIAFVGSPIAESEKELVRLAKKLRKDEVAVDIVSFGVASNTSLLERFVQEVSKNNNSRFVWVSEGTGIYDSVLSSHILFEGGGGGVQGASGGFEFGVDPNIDPELAMVLRMSREEEQLRQERLAAERADSTAQERVEVPAKVTEEESRAMTEEEEIEAALKLSLELAMQEANSQDQASKKTDEGQEEKGTGRPGDAVDPAFMQAIQDPDFMKQLEEAAKQDKDKDKDNDKDNDNDKEKDTSNEEK